MSDELRLVFGDAERKHGSIKALVRAMHGEATLFADTVRLDRADDRREIAEQIVAGAAAAGTSASAGEIERALLVELDRALAALTAREDEAADVRGHAASQADQLVAIGRRGELFHDPLGDTYARMRVGDHVETWATKSGTFAGWLRRAFFEQFRKAPNGEAMASARALLESFALFDGVCRPVYHRVAPDGLGGIVLDLGDAAWRVAHVTPAGWTIASDLSVCFRRSKGMLALPSPARGGRLDDLRTFLNVADDDSWFRIRGWLLAAARERGPYPVLALYGEHGSGKTFAARLLRRLVDPASALLRSDPKNVEDVMIAAKSCHVVAFDNVSHIEPWLSDVLCRLATGGAWATRQFYTNDDEVLFEALRPGLLTGITEFVTRGDLLDRVLQETLVKIDRRNRRPEKELLAAFEAAHPLLVGGLLDDLAAGLRALPETRVAGLPRMADFALWVSAVEGGKGEEPRFLRAYDRARDESHLQAIEASAIGAALLALLGDIGAGLGDLGEDGGWSGTASELLDALGERATDAVTRGRYWPKTPRSLGGEIRRLGAAIRGMGHAFGDRREPGTGRRLFLLGPKVSPDEADEGGARPSRPSRPSRGDHDREGDRPPDRDARADPTVTPTVTGADDAGERGDDVTVEAPDATVRDGRRDGPTRERDGRDGGAPTSSGGGEEVSDDVVLVTDADAARAALATLLAAPVLGLDVETTGLDPRAHRVRLVQLSTGDRTWVFDLFRLDPAVLAPLMAGAGPRLVGHNLKFDLTMLRAAGLPIPDGARLLDTMLAARVLEAGDGDFKQRGRFTLAAVAKRYVGVELDKAEQASDWSGPLTEAQLAYAARDAAVLPRLAERLDRVAEVARLGDTIALEMAALPALVWLEATGAPFDAEAWTALAEAAVRRQVEVRRRLDALAGPADLFGGSGVNWDSPAQVKKALHARGHAVERVDEATLAALAADDELAAAMLDYREATKRAGTYGIEFLKHVHDATGRIHADYQQLGAESGRMSCARPNLQQVPRDPAYRACFRPPEGRVLVKADYSQVELRIAAELARDERLVAAYAAGEDVHALTAAAVLGRGDGPVAKEDRQAAKALNFGLLYGMGVDTLRAHARNNYGVMLSEREAAEFRTRFFRTYAGLKRWHASRPGMTVETRTVGGRRRLGVSAFTQKCNTPVQGTGADGLKAALALLWETRDRCPSAAPVLCVHDEIVVEVDADRAEQASDWVVDCMTRGMQRFLRRVPVVVEASMARDWAGTPVSDAEGRTVA